jgi:serine/threonine-protein kinase HipA
MRPPKRDFKGPVAHVFRNQDYIGKVTRTKQGSTFEYDATFLEAVKTTRPNEEGATYRLPYRRPKTETPGVNVHSFFAGLLPEGLRLKALIKIVKTSEDDLLSLLIASGSHCIGDIFVTPGTTSKAKPPQQSDESIGTSSFSDVDFAALFKKSISPDGIFDEANIPGVQEKISPTSMTSLISFPIRKRRDKASYILKLTPADKPRIVENEFFFLKMAKACGLIVNEATLEHDKLGASGLLVKRFDRDSNGAPIHQEDACQFLDRYPADKYNIAFADIAAGVTELCSAPIIEVGKLLRLTAFSYLIANGDLHAKNISIRTSPTTGRVELTPGYDLLTTLPYGDRQMALKLGSLNDNLKRKQFIEFGKRFAVKEAAIDAILDQICDVAPQWINKIGEIGFTEKKTLHLRQVMKKRLRDLA